MFCLKSTEVEITTFLNPHLFWIFEKDNIPKRRNLEQKLENVPHTLLNSAQLGQFVLVRNNAYKRAIIKDISPPNKYYCWLIDYGVLYNTDEIYKIPSGFSKALPMAKQVALNNVVCVEEVFGATGKVLVESLHFTPGTIKRAKYHIDSAYEIVFQCVREQSDIHIGTVNISDCAGGNLCDLSTLLVHERLVVFNAEMFEKALDINSNSENQDYLKYINTVSPQFFLDGDSNFNDESICSLTTKSVGRARTRRSLVLEAKLETENDKNQDLQKWIEESRNSISEVCDYDDDTKSVSLLSKTLTTNINTLDASHSMSMTTESLDSHIKKIRQLKDRHFAKNAVTSTTLVQGNCSKLTNPHFDTSMSTITDSEVKSLSESFDHLGSISILNQSNTRERSHTNDTSKNKNTDWENFRDSIGKKGSPQQSVTQQLNILPAGVCYATIKKSKTLHVGATPAEKDVLIKNTLDSSVLKTEMKQGVTEMLHNIDPKIVCICSECKKWINDTMINQPQPTICPPKKLSKAPLLFKCEQDKEDEVVIKTFASEMKYRSKVMVDPDIVVHGTIFPQPVQSVSQVPFNATIHNFMRNFLQAYSIQSYIWPSLFRKMNVCVVNPPKSGKTMGYLPVISSYLLERLERYQNLPTNTISPLAVIICPGSSVADEIYDLFVKIMDEVKNRPVVALAVPPMDKACLNQFQRQCDLLITTPIMLVNLLHARIITGKRFCHITLEHADVLLEKFSKEMTAIFNLINSMLKHRNCNYSVQIITISERWTVLLETLIKRLQYTPFICIGHHLEAALYGRADIQMHFLESQHKKLTFCDLIKNCYETCRTIVICTNDDDVCELREALEMKGIKGRYFTKNIEKVEIEEMEVKWFSTVGGKHFVLVCTDEIYNTTLTIKNAVILVHYSLPTTWTQFSKRFSCFTNNYHSPLAKKTDNWTRCKAHVFLDEACGKQFIKLMEFLKRMGCQFSPKIMEYYEQSISAKESLNIFQNVPLCNKVKQFGQCTNSKCKSRHKLSLELDYTNSLPKNGTICFKILNIRSVTSFIVKLLEHTDMDNVKHNLVKHPNLHNDLQISMKKQSPSAVYNAQLTIKYLFHSTADENYYRCIVKKIVQRERITKMPSIVIVKLIDTGITLRVDVVDLYEMPEEFKNIPAEGVEVYLANLIPPDSDDCFSNYSKNKVRTLINTALEDSMAYCSGNIVLQLGNSIWIKNLYVLEDLSSLNITATRLNLSKDLLNQEIANKSEIHLSGLYKLCLDSGINLPEYSKEVVKHAFIDQVEPQWAFLDNTEYTEIYMITVQSPSLFFVQIKKFHSLLLELEENIQNVILKPYYPNSFEICVGQYYLAKDPEGSNYCRAKVININGDMASCFYVDYGDFGSVFVADIKFLTNELIQKLPFQAIECRLYGVQSLFDTWDNESIDIMDQYIFEPESDFFRTLYATTCKIETSTITFYQKFAILLTDMIRNKPIVINKLLIDCGRANNIDIENINVESIHPDVSSNDTNNSINEALLEEIEGKELTFEDIKRLKTKFKPHQDDENGNDDRESMEDTWDFEIDNPELFMKNLLGIPVNPEKQYRNDILPPIRALPSPGYSTPNVEWFQNETHITLTVLLPNLEKYTLHVLRNASLMFKTFHNETQYQFHLQLFDKVKMGQDIVSGLYLKISLLKLQKSVWPRLTLNKERLRFLKYDLKQCSEPEEPKKPILSLGQVLEEGDQLPGEHIIEYGSDGDSSSDDYSIGSGDC